MTWKVDRHGAYVKLKQPKPPRRWRGWRNIQWDGNPALKLRCWRKWTGRWYISVGIGEFLAVVYHFGANSPNSMSSTRWNYDKPPISEEVMMKWIDQMGMRDRSKHPVPGPWTRPEWWSDDQEANKRHMAAERTA
jgi:hypothetical protein